VLSAFVSVYACFWPAFVCVVLLYKFLSALAQTMSCKWIHTLQKHAYANVLHVTQTLSQADDDGDSASPNFLTGPFVQPRALTYSAGDKSTPETALSAESSQQQRAAVGGKGSGSGGGANEGVGEFGSGATREAGGREKREGVEGAEGGEVSGRAKGVGKKDGRVEKGGEEKDVAAAAANVGQQSHQQQQGKASAAVQPDRSQGSAKAPAAEGVRRSGRAASANRAAGGVP
jgi:hypothetical protein